jgi:hypothetical protein
VTHKRSISGGLGYSLAPTGVRAVASGRAAKCSNAECVAEAVAANLTTGDEMAAIGRALEGRCDDQEAPDLGLVDERVDWHRAVMLRGRRDEDGAPPAVPAAPAEPALLKQSMVGFSGEMGAALTEGSARIDDVRRRGAVGILVPLLAIRAAGQAWMGDHARAFADAGEAAELAEHLGYVADASVAVEMLACQLAARGAPRRGERSPRQGARAPRPGRHHQCRCPPRAHGRVLRPVPR